MKKQVKLYNVLFPVWFLIFFPLTWIIVIPGNFFIDLLVLYISFRVLKLDSLWDNIKNSIIKIFLVGFLSDFIGSGILLGVSIGGDYIAYKLFGKSFEFFGYLVQNPFLNPISLIITILAVLISGFSIYKLNLKYSFNKTNLTDLQKHKVSLWLAIFTAPYFITIPTELIYKLSIFII